MDNKNNDNGKDSANNEEIIQNIKKMLGKNSLSGRPISGANVEKKKGQMRKIFSTLQSPTWTYSPEETIKEIQEYIKMDGEKRLLYSEITIYIFSLSDEEIGIVDSNLLKLIESLKGSDSNSESKAIVMKLYDHINLARYQAKKIEEALDNKANELQRSTNAQLDSKSNALRKTIESKLEERMRRAQKEYITILGIFASVIVTFTAGMIFSSSVLNNIDKVSAYRLIGISLLIGFVTFNLLYVFLSFIYKMTELKENGIPFKYPFLIVNLVFLAASGLLFCWWSNGKIELRNQQVHQTVSSPYPSGESKDNQVSLSVDINGNKAAIQQVK